MILKFIKTQTCLRILKQRKPLFCYTYQWGWFYGGKAALVLVVLGLAALVRGGRSEPCSVVPVDSIIPVVLMVLCETHTNKNTTENEYKSLFKSQSCELLRTNDTRGVKIKLKTAVLQDTWQILAHWELCQCLNSSPSFCDFLNTTIPHWFIHTSKISKGIFSIC